MNILDIDHQWVAVEADSGKRYIYPNKVTRHIRENYSRVAVYRWALYRSQPTGDLSIIRLPHAVYVGEAENLAQRLQGYLHPGRSQQTNKRIKECFDSELRSGSTIELHVFKFCDFHLLMDRACQTYELISINALSNPFIRKLVENIGVIAHDASCCKIVNRALNPMDRRREKALKLTEAHAQTH